VLKVPILWLDLQFAASVSLVKSVHQPLLPEQLALLVNTHWLGQPFAWTALQGSSAQVDLLRVVVLAAIALLDLPQAAKHALLAISARLLIKNQYCVLSAITLRVDLQLVLSVKLAITAPHPNKE
jgi:hypothetical protein